MNVAVAVGQGFTARVLLDGRLLPLLRACGHRIAIFAPAAALPALAARFADSGISWLELRAQEGKKDLLANYLRLLLADWRATGTLALREAERWQARAWRRRLWPLRRHFVAPAWARRAYHGLENRLLPDRDHREAIAESRPDVLLTATAGVLPGDRRLIRAARAAGVPSVAYVQGWDNLTSKTVIGARPDRVLVWSLAQREEALRIHGFAPEEVAVTGPVHFDDYLRREGWRTREEILARLGVAAPARLILLAAAPQRYYADSAAVADILLAALDAGAFGDDVALVVRVHPQATAGPDHNADELRRRLAGRAHVDVPRGTPGLEHDGGPGAGRWIGELVAAADVVVTICSSMILDAAVLDRPIVNVGFDAGERPYLQSARRHWDTDHYAQVMASGAAAPAASAAELVAAVREALARPDAGRPARRRLVATACGPLDGGASERLVAALAAVARDRSIGQRRRRAERAVGGPPQLASDRDRAAEPGGRLAVY